MGVFDNEAESAAYYDAYCSRCIHEKQFREEGRAGCVLWFLQITTSNDEARKPGSMLNALIPRDRVTGINKECQMFYPAPSMGLPFEDKKS